MCRSFCLISPLQASEKAEIYFIWKVTSIASIWVQAVFCAISRSRDTRKTKLGKKLEELEILRYLAETFTRKYWSCRTKTIPEQRQPKQITYFQKHQLTKYHFQTTDKVNNVKNIFLGLKISILCLAFFCQHWSNTVFRILEIWYPILFSSYLGSPISHRILLVLETKLWMSPFKWNMFQSSRMHVAGDIKQTLRLDTL